ncbi:hypothetical protein ACOJCM_12330 [Billgrantia sp. LNSP4103-1]|uniref:hypothetical protein n=1 Tax=Billgrantia sp. LNSP4103-1 TaxID=3410266 RepID=UPI00403F94FC
MKLRVLALLLALSVIPGAALADRPDPISKPLITYSSGHEAPLIKRSYEQLDADQDGRLSRAETVGAALTDSFVGLDRNRDDFLSRQEYYYQPN